MARATTALVGAALALGLGSGLWSCGGGEGADASPERPRNVILFVVDTLRADRLGCYGYERDTSPNIDLLAARGTLYENNRSQAPWTVPSMISMMTGLYVTDEEQVLPPNQPTLAELVQESGRTTAAFIGNRVLTTNRGFERGFDHFEYTSRKRALSVFKRFRDWYEANEVELESGDGFFAWLHALDPHHPYEPKEQYDVFEGARPGQSELERRWAREAPRLAELSPNLEPWSLDEAREFIEVESNRYDGEVLASDAAVKQLMEFLHEQGQLEDTLLIFAADHGELLYEYPHYPLELSIKRESNGGLPRGVADMFAVGHRAWYYPELWNTPLILAGPGIPAGQRRTGLSGNLDLWPTILEALEIDTDGLAIDEGALREGRSLVGGPEIERERIYAHGFQTTAVLEAEGLQLIDHAPRRFLLDEDGPRVQELYDLRLAGEIHDRIDEYPADGARMTSQMGAWRSSHQRQVVITVPGTEAQDALRELGYLDELGD
ncbi:sulfatase [Engelhardtia mirabilis]|uniref:sulfatase n=1 Tax=Engelhardtia mirabilis TaxID=2528011 RepID=UPI003AF33BF3